MGANCRLTHPLTIVAAACVLRWLLGNTNMGINREFSKLLIRSLPVHWISWQLCPLLPFLLSSTVNRVEQNQQQTNSWKVRNSQAMFKPWLHSIQIQLSFLQSYEVWQTIKQQRNETNVFHVFLFLSILWFNHKIDRSSIAAWYIWSRTTNRFPLPPELPHPTVSPFMWVGYYHQMPSNLIIRHSGENFWESCHWISSEGWHIVK